MTSMASNNYKHRQELSKHFPELSHKLSLPDTNDLRVQEQHQQQQEIQQQQLQETYEKFLEVKLDPRFSSIHRMYYQFLGEESSMVFR